MTTDYKVFRELLIKNGISFNVKCNTGNKTIVTMPNGEVITFENEKLVSINA